MTRQDLEALARTLDASDDYRVVRRYQRPEHYGLPSEDTTLRTGIYLDTETTGFDEHTCKIIELAMVKFDFSPDGRIFRVQDEYDEFNDPGAPIPPEIVSLTGITDEMVAGQRIDPADVTRFLDGTALLIAHNAGFDRRFTEAHLDGFAQMPWACSQTQVDWRAAGYESSKLEYLAYRAGFFYTGHRAISDCLAGLHLLATPLPDGERPFAELLRNARRTQVRIYAMGSPFETKDTLRNRGYRWNPGDNGKPKAWFVDVDEDQLDDEMAFLREDIFHRAVKLPTERITATNRFSSRV